MADLAVQTIKTDGTPPVYAAAGVGGDQVLRNVEGKKTFLRVKNGSAAAINVTVNSQKVCNMGFDHDLVVPVAAAGESDIGPLDDSRFNDPQGNVQVTYSAVTSVTVAALKVPS